MAAHGLSVEVRRNELPRIAREIAPRVHAELTAAGRNMEKDAKTRVPVRTGRLRNSIHSAVNDMTVDLYATEPYAARIEYGFHGADSRGRVYHQAGRPYLVPALEREKAQLIERIKRVFGL